MRNDVKNQGEQAKRLLSELNAFAKEHNLSNRELAEKLDIPYKTLNA